MSSVADVPRDGVKLIEIDQGQLRQHVNGLVRNAVEETLNALLDAGADQLCGAKRYERSPDRTDYRAGSYTRRLHTRAGEVELKVPKLRQATFERQVIEQLPAAREVAPSLRDYSLFAAAPVLLCCRVLNGGDGRASLPAVPSVWDASPLSRCVAVSRPRGRRPTARPVRRRRSAA